MNHQFDELAKGLAQSVTRRGALKKFGVGVAGFAVAALGLANRAEAATQHCVKWACLPNGDYSEQYYCSNVRPPARAARSTSPSTAPSPTPPTASGTRARRSSPGARRTPRTTR